MGHPAGQLSDGLHLLGLEQLRFQALVLGDIRGYPGIQDDTALVVPDRIPPVVNPAYRPVGLDNPVFVVPGDFFPVGCR